MCEELDSWRAASSGTASCMTVEGGKLRFRNTIVREMRDAGWRLGVHDTPWFLWDI
jgi:hypothetical protein